MPSLFLRLFDELASVHAEKVKEQLVLLVFKLLRTHVQQDGIVGILVVLVDLTLRGHLEERLKFL